MRKKLTETRMYILGVVAKSCLLLYIPHFKIAKQMRVLIVRHAQSENNIVQAEAHISMSRGEITPEAAQVWANL
jgi:hypothetical protein